MKTTLFTIGVILILFVFFPMEAFVLIIRFHLFGKPMPEYPTYTGKATTYLINKLEKL